ncbi:MAG: MarR family transcriptional regulator [Opitutaceae bacterium]|nr:MarR family transcriptional regulator [Opitutaceae bacterium]
MRHKERHLIATPARATDDLWVLIGRVYLNYTVFLQEQLEADGLAEHIRPGMGHLLFALFAEDNLTLRDLTARTGLAPSSVTETVQRMERQGLISRVRDAADKRAVRISLTRKARSLEPRCRALASQMRDVLEQGFTAAEARRLRAGLSRVIKNLHERLKPADSD